jgi:outer membrane lipoprotein-sorting protein
MKSRVSIRIFVILAFTVLALSATAQDAATILGKMDHVLYAPKDMTGTYTITLVDKNGKKETRKANILQKGTDKRIMRFIEPASQAGIAVLALPDEIMYMYLPAFGKERRIASSVKNQNFAGTDFSYDDMEPKPYADKYDSELLRTEGDHHVVQLVPKGRSDYSKIIAYINKTAYYPESMEYFDKGNMKIKEATYHFKKVGNYWNSEEIVMTDLKKNHKTIMNISDVKYDTGLSDDEFSIRKLRQ